MVLSGDDRQLAAFSRIQWGIVPIMRACNVSVSSTLLAVQRRQPNNLGHFMSALSYEGLVSNAPNGLNVTQLGHKDLVVGIWPDVCTGPRFPSLAEALLAMSLFSYFHNKYPDWTIRIISPYASQVRQLIDLRMDRKNVHTVDSFQGSWELCCFRSFRLL